MSESVLEEYLSTIPDPRGERLVRELDLIIRSASSELEAAIKYRILMYG